MTVLPKRLKMSLSNADRLEKCAARMRWFEDNEKDLRKDIIQPYISAIDILVRQMEELRAIPDELLEALEKTIKQAEEELQPEDAHAFKYDKNFKLF